MTDDQSRQVATSPDSEFMLSAPPIATNIAAQEQQDHQRWGTLPLVSPALAILRAMKHGNDRNLAGRLVDFILSWTALLPKRGHLFIGCVTLSALCEVRASTASYARAAAVATSPDRDFALSIDESVERYAHAG